MLDPRFRLKRSYPGERLHRESPLEGRLQERQVEEAPRVTVPDRTGSHEQKVRVLRPQVRPEPNAPLLKRLARYPYRHDARGPVRQQTRSEIPWKELERMEREAPSMIYREARGELILGSPMKRIDHRPTTPARPSADAWLAGKEAQ